MSQQSKHRTYLLNEIQSTLTHISSKPNKRKVFNAKKEDECYMLFAIWFGSVCGKCVELNEQPQSVASKKGKYGIDVLSLIAFTIALHCTMYNGKIANNISIRAFLT